MSTYLAIAEAVLSKSKTPMSARQILEAAYRLQLVPDHLFGKTQHKTLHARLSEDLISNKTDTVFIRTAPGRFQLRHHHARIADVPPKYVAPLRAYQLKQFDVICATRGDLIKLWPADSYLLHFDIIASSLLQQLPLQQAERRPDLIHLRVFVVVRWLNKILTLAALAGANLGRGRALGFLGYLKASDTDLFSSDPWGIDNAARRTIAEQSTIPMPEIKKFVEQLNTTPQHCLRLASPIKQNDSAIILVTSYLCTDPEGMLSHIPAHRMPRWLEVPREINDFDALEPVSNLLLREDTVAGVRSFSSLL